MFILGSWCSQSGDIETAFEGFTNLVITMGVTYVARELIGQVLLANHGCYAHERYSKADVLWNFMFL